MQQGIATVIAAVPQNRAYAFFNSVTKNQALSATRTQTSGKVTRANTNEEPDKKLRDIPLRRRG